MNINPGAPLAPLAQLHAERGWQLVACQWHVDQRTGRRGTTPLPGMTGRRVPFLTGAQVAAKVRHLLLHPQGGPECVGRLAKPAIRPPAHVVGLDVDDGYGGKSGGDTLVAAEMALGPLPGSYSSTARGPYQPSRRIFYRKPADLVLQDDYFREFGGCIEIIRTGHRYSWTWPAVHHKNSKPVLWHDPSHEVAELPHVDDLPELPGPWVRRGYELMVAAQDTERTPPGQSRPITVHHAEAIVAKSVRTFMGPPYLEGGDFRNAVFGLAANLTRRAVARGHRPAEVRGEMAKLFAQHPTRARVGANDRDLMWIEDGIARGTAEPWRFEMEIYLPDGTLSPETIAAISATYPDDEDSRRFLLADGRQPDTSPPAVEIDVPEPRPGVTDAELETFLASFTRYRDPARLGRRTSWMRADVRNTRRMHTHAKALIEDVIAGAYPAEKAITALVSTYRQAGCTDPVVPRRVFVAALNTVLSSKVAV